MTFDALLSYVGVLVSKSHGLLFFQARLVLFDGGQVFCSWLVLSGEVYLESHISHDLISDGFLPKDPAETAKSLNHRSWQHL